MNRITLAIVAAACLIGQPAWAVSNLQITELWPGGLAGAEATSDWFELTNFGDMAATGLDGNLYWDDDSFDPTKNDPLVGIGTIAPGESVIYVVSWEGGFATSADAISAFSAMWDAPAGDLSGVQIGYVDGGSGLGGSGDVAVVFDGNTSAATPVDFAAYTAVSQEESFVSGFDGAWVDNTFAQVNVLGAYLGNNNATDDALSTPPIGSPGTVAGVPEPSGIALAALALLSLVSRRPLSSMLYKKQANAF